MIELAPAPDFDGDGKAFLISGVQQPGEIRLDQLAYEIGAAHGWGDDVGNWNYSWDQELKAVVLWTSRKDIDLKKLAATARKHKRNDKFVTPNQPANP